MDCGAGHVTWPVSWHAVKFGYNNYLFKINFFNMNIFKYFNSEHEFFSENLQNYFKIYIKLKRNFVKIQLISFYFTVNQT